MLVISRRKNETITIEPIEGLDPTMTLERAFQDGPIEIRLVHVSSSKVRLAIEAPQELRIWRGLQIEPSSIGPVGADSDEDALESTEHP
jgi:sRNA-binding carbon storage regulator CsrA